MIELVQHIRQLILTHDCVIIPGFGGFIANRLPARIMHDGRSMLPPGKSIGFNQHLTLNDGLLIQSVMNSEGLSYPAAEKQVNAAAEKMKAEIRRHGQVMLPGIGCLQKDIRGDIRFTSLEETVMSVQSYGLERLEIKKAKDLEQERPAATVQKGRKTRLSIWKPVAKYAAAAIAAAAMYFMAALPVNDFSSEHFDDFAAIAPAGLINGNAEKPAQPVIITAAAETEKPAQTPEAAPAQPEKPAQPVAKPQAPAAQQKAEPKASAEKYHIIIASVVSEADAQTAAKRLKDRGYKGASCRKSKTNSRISIASFASYDEALAKLREIRKQQEFKDAWLLTE